LRQTHDPKKSSEEICPLAGPNFITVTTYENDSESRKFELQELSLCHLQKSDLIPVLVISLFVVEAYLVVGFVEDYGVYLRPASYGDGN
jgi:hypothetical protein